MNKTKYLILSIIIYLLLSCNVNFNNNFQTKNRIFTEYNGIEVLLKENIPEEILHYSINEYQDQITDEIKLFSKNAISTNINIDQLKSAYDEIISEENYDIFEDQTDENILLKIRNDFPTLTEKEITQNIDTIKEIYAQQIRYQLFNKLKDAELPEIISKGGDYPEGLYSDEFWLLFWNPWQIGPTEKSVKDAEKYTTEKYTYSNWADRSDAMRHVLWNILLSSYVSGSIAERIDWTTKFTYAHETGALKWVEKHNKTFNPLDTPMDYHNNIIGRNYFETHASEKDVWWWKEVTIPNIEKSVQDAFELSQKGVRFYNINELTSLTNTVVFFRGM